MLTGVLSKDMDYYVAEVHEHPLRRGFPFNAQCSAPRLGQDAVNMIGYGPGLAIRFCGAQDDVIGYRGQFRNMEDEDVRGLFVEHGPRDCEGCGL